MDRLLPYLLLILLAIATWNDSLSSRFQRLTGSEGSQQQVALDQAAAAATPIPKRTPFWQQPGYRNSLEPNKNQKSH